MELKLLGNSYRTPMLKLPLSNVNEYILRSNLGDFTYNGTVVYDIDNNDEYIFRNRQLTKKNEIKASFRHGHVFTTKNFIVSVFTSKLEIVEPQDVDTKFIFNVKDDALAIYCHDNIIKINGNYYEICIVPENKEELFTELVK